MWIPTIAFAALAVIAQAPDQKAPTPGTVTVQLADADTLPPELRQSLVEGVQRALAEANFMALPTPGHSRYVARATVTRRSRGLAEADADEAAPASNLGNWGARLRVTLPSDKTQTRGLFLTELDLAIVLRRTGRTVWSGSAITAEVDGTREGAPEAVAYKLARALIGRFPATLAEPISVP
jgi:hypothetical protein